MDEQSEVQVSDPGLDAPVTEDDLGDAVKGMDDTDFTTRDDP